MTPTVVLENIPATSPQDVSVYIFDQSKLIRQVTEVVANGVRTTYIYNDGDPNVDTTVSYQVTSDPKKGTIRTAIRLSTIEVVSDGGDETERAPIEANMFWITPGRSEDPGAVLSMLGSLFSLAFDGLTSKVPNDGTIGALNRGATEVL